MGYTGYKQSILPLLQLNYETAVFQEPVDPVFDGAQDRLQHKNYHFSTKG
jgi:hypothetical protein